MVNRPPAKSRLTTGFFMSGLNPQPQEMNYVLAVLEVPTQKLG